ncbi:CDP-alcohol phosphatidyltransferase family protein [Thermodesulfobacteriota bacterium]
MDRAISIIIALLISLLMYLGFVFVLKSRKGRDYIGSRWYYHPNAICVWRVFIGLPGTLLYSVAGQHTWGILLFTISAVLDGVDGLIARRCDQITPLGEELDPLCDKLTYLPPIIFFAYRGLMNVPAVYVFLIIEASGQFLVRYIIKRFTKFSVAANNFGKIKAVLCFALIIYCALLEGGYRIPELSEQILYTCIVLSISSSVFKLIANRFYADILSILNLSCGVIGIFLVFQGRYVYTAIAILAGQIFDLLDGRMAEKHGGTKFGPWFDDIADLVSFGACPGLLILLKGNMGLPSFIFGILYFLAIGFRLWRYLARDKHDNTLPPGMFNGLPSPAGAMVALGACLFWENFWIIWTIILLTSFLLVSHIRFVHFGRVILKRIPRPLIIVFGFIIVFIIAYLIKVRDSGMLGALLLICFLIYVITSSKIVIMEAT